MGGCRLATLLAFCLIVSDIGCSCGGYGTGVAQSSKKKAPKSPWHHPPGFLQTAGEKLPKQDQKGSTGSQEPSLLEREGVFESHLQPNHDMVLQKLPGTKFDEGFPLSEVQGFLARGVETTPQVTKQTPERQAKAGQVSEQREGTGDRDARRSPCFSSQSAMDSINAIVQSVSTCRHDIRPELHQFSSATEGASCKAEDVASNGCYDQGRAGQANALEGSHRDEVRAAREVDGRVCKAGSQGKSCDERQDVVPWTHQQTSQTGSTGPSRQEQDLGDGQRMGFLCHQSSQQSATPLPAPSDVQSGSHGGTECEGGKSDQSQTGGGGSIPVSPRAAWIHRSHPGSPGYVRCNATATPAGGRCKGDGDFRRSGDSGRRRHGVECLGGGRDNAKGDCEERTEASAISPSRFSSQGSQQSPQSESSQDRIMNHFHGACGMHGLYTQICASTGTDHGYGRQVNPSPNCFAWNSSESKFRGDFEAPIIDRREKCVRFREDVDVRILSADSIRCDVRVPSNLPLLTV